MKNISILGATGSIGLQSIDVIKYNREKFNLKAISVGNNIDKLREILKDFFPDLVCVKNENDIYNLKIDYPNIKFTHGDEGLLEVASYEKSDLIINSLVGNVGLLPTINAIENNKTVALANKETLVTAGHIINEKLKKHNVNLIPIDSEHCAIFQCLNDENPKDINKIILTASGGSAKITIDSATMVNKGLEIIEAHFLFGIDYDKIDVVLHKESIIHSMVEFNDKTIMAQMGTPDMKNPIQYALTYPDRIFNESFEQLNLSEIGTLNFSKLDFDRYPCVKMAIDSGKIGGSMTTVFNSSNEEAVKLFLNNQISFLDIEILIYEALNSHSKINSPDLKTILELDCEIRQFVNNFSKTLKATH